MLHYLKITRQPGIINVYKTTYSPHSFSLNGIFNQYYIKFCFCQVRGLHRIFFLCIIVLVPG